MDSREVGGADSARVEGDTIDVDAEYREGVDCLEGCDMKPSPAADPP
mgnify:CR=1 FL=1